MAKKTFNITVGHLRSGNFGTILTEAGQPSSITPVTLTIDEDPTVAPVLAETSTQEVTRVTNPTTSTSIGRKAKGNRQ